jgi:hypothetical protein
VMMVSKMEQKCVVEIVMENIFGSVVFVLPL